MLGLNQHLMHHNNETFHYNETFQLSPPLQCHQDSYCNIKISIIALNQDSELQDFTVHSNPVIMNHLGEAKHSLSAGFALSGMD